MPYIKTGWTLDLIALWLYAILVNIGILFNPDIPIPTDAPPFLKVVELLQGNYLGEVVPFRIQYPIYPYLAWAVGFLIPDKLFAARLASFVPAVICPLLVYMSCHLIGCGRRASLIGAFLLASAPPLIHISSLPLYDSLFVCMTAASLAAILAAVRRPSVISCAGAAAICGVAAATRGPGLFFVIALIVSILSLPKLMRSQKIIRAALCLLVTAGSLFVARYPARSLSASLTNANPACMKQLIQDGILYSKGTHIRDAAVYGLAEDCTSMGSAVASVCRMGWLEFIGMHGKEWAKMALENWNRLLLYDLAQILSPFIVLAFPISLGIYGMILKGGFLVPQHLTILCMSVPFLLGVPAIQLQERYLYPLFVMFCVVGGLGAQVALDSLYKTGRMVAVILVALAALAASVTVENGMARDVQWQNYRAACEWIVSFPRLGPATRVMVRNHGVYAFLHRDTIPMPIGSIESTLCFARANGVDAIIDGPLERNHNPNIDSPTTDLEQIRVFGEGPDRVAVLAVKKPAEQVIR
jgi:4-amino-4-deoxy-L-arabinose transferase-like glycosyltransferase